MRIFKKLLIIWVLLLLLPLTACSVTSKATRANSVPVVPQVIYPRPQALDLKAGIKWVGRADPLLCLSPEDYEDLSLNWQELVRYMKDLEAWGEMYESERSMGSRQPAQPAE